MPAYAIFTRKTLSDPKELDIYASLVPETFKGHPVKVLAAYGKQDRLEGNAPDGVVIIEFPDAAAARAWYDSPAYQNAAKHRWKAADYDAVIVDGV